MWWLTLSSLRWYCLLQRTSDKMWSMHSTNLMWYFIVRAIYGFKTVNRDATLPSSPSDFGFVCFGDKTVLRSLGNGLCVSTHSLCNGPTFQWRRPTSHPASNQKLVLPKITPPSVKPETRTSLLNHLSYQQLVFSRTKPWPTIWSFYQPIRSSSQSFPDPLPVFIMGLW